MKIKTIFTQSLSLFNCQFIKRLIYRWLLILLILLLATWLFFLQLEIQTLIPTTWQAAEKFPGRLALIGLPAIITSSLVVSILNTKIDKKKNYPRVYWIAYLIPIFILSVADYYAYRYYVNYTTQRDQKRRYNLELEIKNNNHPDYEALAEMYQNGWGGPQDIKKASELYQKACIETTTIKSIAIQTCKKARNYQRLRILLQDSKNPNNIATLANLYKAGLGGPQDLAKAEELFHKACPRPHIDYDCKNYYEPLE